MGMHIKAKAIIKECYEKNKSGDPNFRSLTNSMKECLRQTVGETYWKKAHDFLDHFLKQKTSPEDDKVEAEKRKAREAAEQKKRKEKRKNNWNYAELIKQKIINLGDIDLVDDDLDEVIKTIEQSTVLEELVLGDNELTLADGKFAHAIAKNKTIKRLYLWSNNIGVEGAKHLANALKKNNTVKELSLTSNGIGNEEYIADMLAINKTLQEIRLVNNNIGGPGGRKLAEARFWVTMS